MYLDYFGLNELPFNMTPNPRFLFQTSGHAQALEHLRFGVTQRRGFILLTGDVGTGKTTLCRTLLHELPNEFRTALILDPCLSETQLLRAILHEFGMTEAKGDRLALREMLYRFLLEQLAGGRDVVLIIDEAQHLTLAQLEQVRLFSNLETDDRKLMQIVLAGQPELSMKLAEPRLRQLRQRITVRHHLGPISTDEADGYIRHRLNVAGASERPSFDDDAIGCIYEESGGVPRLVNAISDMSLLAAFAMQTDCVTATHVRSAAQELQGSLS